MKKVILCIALMLGFSSVFVTESSAKLKDSPRSGYNSFVSSTTVYNKPNGKKIGKIKSGFSVDYPEGTDYVPNRVKIIKFVNEKWVKVKYASKAPEYQKNLVRNKVGYIKVKYLKVNLYSLDYVIVNAKDVNLRSKATSSSKVIQKIPLGTRLEYYYDMNGNEGPFINIDDSKKTGWVKVQYVKKGKKYVGYVAYKYIH
ncbi:SH3 domain-containing protein [Kurthia sp. FSL E2-0154]|uniref:SH3 domain-containing protein n=1 Tax=Kurthia sp. FSL E2-0154 TaxID=2921358 RepID=UPI0030FAF79E